MSSEITKRFRNFANAGSKTDAPKQVNRNETVSIDFIDTHDWTIDPKTGGLRNENPGSWNILSQYQLCNIKPVKDAQDTQIDGWFIVNGKVIDLSDATSTATNKNVKNVLVISLNYTFKKGDVVEFGIRSSSRDKKLNANVCHFVAPSKVVAPSIIVTASKLPLR